MEARQIIQSLIDSRRSEPYGNTQSFQLGYVIELLCWVASFHPDVLDDLKELQRASERKAKEKGKDQ
jgi:hypothetical protein